MTVPPLETRICVWDDKTGQMIEVYVANGNRDSLPDAVRRATNDAVNPDLAPVVISKDGGVEIRRASRVTDDSGEYLTPAHINSGDMGSVLFEGCSTPVTVKPASVVRFGNGLNSTKVLAPKSK